MATQTTSFTATTLLDQINGDLGLRGSNLYTLADVHFWVERVIREATQQTHWYQVTDTVDATSGTKEYDLPTNCISLIAIAHDSIPLDQISYEDLLVFDPFWRQQTSGTPYAWYLRGMTAYGLHPTPGTTITGGIQRIYSAIPTQPSGDATAFNFPLASEALIVAYCLYRAALKDRSGEGGRVVGVYQQEYLAEMERFIRQVNAASDSELLVVGAETSIGDWRYDRQSQQIVPAPS